MVATQVPSSKVLRREFRQIRGHWQRISSKPLATAPASGSPLLLPLPHITFRQAEFAGSHNYCLGGKIGVPGVFQFHRFSRTRSLWYQRSQNRPVSPFPGHTSHSPLSGPVYPKVHLLLFTSTSSVLTWTTVMGVMSWRGGASWPTLPHMRASSLGRRRFIHQPERRCCDAPSPPATRVTRRTQPTVRATVSATDRRPPPAASRPAGGNRLSPASEPVVRENRAGWYGR